MLRLLGLLCLLVVSSVTATETSFASEDVDNQAGTRFNFWKVMFNTYYSMKGLRNETTDAIVDAFFDHEFKVYPQELYPAFKKIFEHISKSNDRIWNFYESILFLYHNVEAADRIYDTVLKLSARGELLKESGELDLDFTFPLVEPSESEHGDLRRRSGMMSEEDLASDFEQPCEECAIPSLQVGSIRAVPGVHFPNYEEIPITSFSCAGKHIPGFYADLETGCQVFHVCYPHRRESFLCPTGTTFNQAILACDYWYSSNCSLAPLYFITGPQILDEYLREDKESFVDHLLEKYDNLDTTSTASEHPIDAPTKESEEPEKKYKKPKSPKIKISLPNIDWTLMIKFLPVKSKITEFPDVFETTPCPTESTTAEVVTHPVVTPKKDKYKIVPSRPTVTPTPEKRVEKATKSEILLDIVKAVKVLTKDAEGVLSKMQQKKQHDLLVKKPIVAPPPKEPISVPEINPRFVVKPAKLELHLRRPKVTRSKSLKPSKQILKTQIHEALRKKEPSKLVLGGLKAMSHLFD